MCSLTYPVLPTLNTTTSCPPPPPPPPGPQFTRIALLPLFACAAGALTCATPAPSLPALPQLLGQAVPQHLEDSALDLLPHTSEAVKLARWGGGRVAGRLCWPGGGRDGWQAGCAGQVGGGTGGRQAVLCCQLHTHNARTYARMHTHTTHTHTHAHVFAHLHIIINSSSSSIGVQELLPIPPTATRPGLGACNRCDTVPLGGPVVS